MEALVLVDLQNDFVPGGALAVPDGDQVVAVANRLMPHFKLVVATQDWHPRNHTSFASQHSGKKAGDVIKIDGISQILWPDHCIQDTHGGEIVADLERENICRTFQKGTDAQLDDFSGFFDRGRRRSTGLNEFLHEQAVTTIFLMGLATEYCVKHTALDGVALGFETTVILDGCRGINLHETDAEQAIQEMRKAGVHVMKSEDRFWVTTKTNTADHY
jgi:nicotinamidase/pyrazinamidase